MNLYCNKLELTDVVVISNIMPTPLNSITFVFRSGEIVARIIFSEVTNWSTTCHGQSLKTSKEEDRIWKKFHVY